MKTLNMTTYLELEIERFKQMGWEFPTPLEDLLRKRARHLDKQAMAEQARRAYAPINTSA